MQLASAIGAGLATGLLRFPDPASVAVALLAGAAVLRRRAPAVVALAAVLAIGRGGQLRESIPGHCASRLPLGERRVVVRLLDPGTGTGRVRPVATDCRGTVVARWPEGAPVGAGATATVIARWRPRSAPMGRPEGTLAIRSVIGSTPGGGLVARSRNRVAEAIRRRFGPQAPLVEALLTGRRGDLDRELTEAFAASGLIHLLAISGFHVGVVVGWLVLAAGLLGFPRHRILPLAAAAVLGYAGWLGWPPPATRAAVFVALLAVMHRRQRAVGRGGLLGATAGVVLLLDPWAISRPGAWLSFSAVLGVGWATRWTRRAIGAPAALPDSLAASLGATVATAPLTAGLFGRVALVGPLLNLLAVPLVALLVPVAAVSVLLDGILPGVAAAYAATASLLLTLLEALARWGALLPGAAVAATPGVAAALPWCGLLVVALVATRGGTTAREAGRRAAWGGSILLWLLLLGDGGATSPGAGRLTLHFLDVGQGDAIALRSPAGRWILVDAGPADDRWDAGERIVLPRLRRLGAGRLELLVLSHPHRDHVGGVGAVVRSLPVGVLVEGGVPFRERGYLGTLALLESRGVRWHPVASGDEWNLDGVAFRVVHPAEGWPGRGGDPNEDSVVLEVRYGAFTALLTGDAGVVAESVFVARLGPVDLLKVGHHGSRGATGEGLLAATAPAVAVLSSGRNRYGHPAAEALARLARHGVAVWRTDREGEVVVETDGRSFTVRGGRHVATFDAGELNHGDPACCMQPR